MAGESSSEYQVLTKNMIESIDRAIGQAAYQAAMAQDMTKAGFKVTEAKNNQKNFEGIRDLVR